MLGELITAATAPSVSSPSSQELCHYLSGSIGARFTQPDTFSGMSLLQTWSQTSEAEAQRLHSDFVGFDSHLLSSDGPLLLQREGGLWWRNSVSLRKQEP